MTFDSNSASLSVLWGQILFVICLTIACHLIFWFQLATIAIHMLHMFFSGIWSIANCHLVAFTLLCVFVCVVLMKIFGPILDPSAAQHSSTFIFYVFNVCPYPPLPPHAPGTLGTYLPSLAWPPDATWAERGCCHGWDFWKWGQNKGVCLEAAEKLLRPNHGGQNGSF